MLSKLQKIFERPVVVPAQVISLWKAKDGVDFFFQTENHIDFFYRTIENL